WTPGTNNIGQRISILMGLADWETPAYSAVFPATALAGVSNPDKVAAATTNAATIGMSYRWGDRTPKPTSDRWKTLLPELQRLDLDIVNAGTNSVLVDQRKA